MSEEISITQREHNLLIQRRKYARAKFKEYQSKRNKLLKELERVNAKVKQFELFADDSRFDEQVRALRADLEAQETAKKP